MTLSYNYFICYFGCIVLLVINLFCRDIFINNLVLVNIWLLLEEKEKPPFWGGFFFS